jgi:cell division protein ZapA (FtsZ GTPase activity inhibitor)
MSANVVTVLIAGEEYTLRAQATAEYTRQCAAYLDDVIREIRRQAGPALERDRVAILAGLALADQLLQTRESAEQLRTGALEVVNRLAKEIEARLADAHLAAPS